MKKRRKMINEFSNISQNSISDINTNKKPKTKKSLVTVKRSSVWSESSDSYSNPSSTKNSPSSKNSSSISPPSNPSGIPNKRNMLSFSLYESEENFQEEEKIPDIIEGEYKYDYNILYIDEIIKKKFEQDKKTQIVHLQNQLEVEKTRIAGKQNYIERKNSKKRIEEIEKDIYNVENSIDKNNYINKTKNILSEYLKLGTINTCVSFVSNDKKQEETIPEDNETQFLRHQIIFNYLEIARKYININLVRIFPNSNHCSGCDLNLNENEMIEDDSGSLICPNCSLEKINIVKKPFFSDGSRVNNSRNNYEDRANFEKVLMRYQGKQINKPRKELYDKLEEYFISRGLKSSKEYNEMPLLKDGTKEGTTKDMMFEALANINCSGYYDDINLILNVFFGWSLPDISYLEEDLMRDYDLSQKAYELIPDKEGRKSSLNAQFRLYCLLKKHNYPCKFRDFKIPSTQSILEYHKIMWKQICSILGWKYIF